MSKYKVTIKVTDICTYVENGELAGENHRLRECMSEMHGHIKECCDGCDEWYCSEWDEDNECCRFDTMMRVCGIEVG